MLFGRDTIRSEPSAPPGPPEPSHHTQMFLGVAHHDAQNSRNSFHLIDALTYRHHYRVPCYVYTTQVEGDHDNTASIAEPSRNHMEARRSQ